MVTPPFASCKFNFGEGCPIPCNRASHWPITAYLRLSPNDGELALPGSRAIGNNLAENIIVGGARCCMLVRCFYSPTVDCLSISMISMASAVKLACASSDPEIHCHGGCSVYHGVHTCTLYLYMYMYMQSLYVSVTAMIAFVWSKHHGLYALRAWRLSMRICMTLYIIMHQYMLLVTFARAR